MIRALNIHFWIENVVLKIGREKSIGTLFFVQYPWFGSDLAVLIILYNNCLYNVCTVNNGREGGISHQVIRGLTSNIRDIFEGPFRCRP